MVRTLGQVAIVFVAAVGTALIAGNALLYLIRRGRYPWDGGMK